MTLLASFGANHRRTPRKHSSPTTLSSSSPVGLEPFGTIGLLGIAVVRGFAGFAAAMPLVYLPVWAAWRRESAALESLFFNCAYVVPFGAYIWQFFWVHHWQRSIWLLLDSLCASASRSPSADLCCNKNVSQLCVAYPFKRCIHAVPTTRYGA